VVIIGFGASLTVGFAGKKRYFFQKKDLQVHKEALY